MSFSQNRLSACALAISGATSLIFTATFFQPAQASTCTYYPAYDTYRFTGNEAAAAGFSCTVGDKTFTSFSGSAVSDDLQFIIGTIGDSHYLTIESNLFSARTTSSVAYTLTANAPTIMGMSTYAGSNFTGPSGIKLATDLEDTLSGSIASYVNNFGSETSTPVAFSPTVQTLQISAALSVDPTTIDTPDTWVHRFQQVSVPGPLPVLGVAAAFGFSRKLRRRISQQSS